MNIKYFYGKTMRSNEGKNITQNWYDFIKLFQNPIIQDIEYTELQKILAEKNNFKKA